MSPPTYLDEPCSLAEQVMQQVGNLRVHVVDGYEDLNLRRGLPS
jgi:hypothetical protein